ncbi:MAG: nucleoside triphosphate pyrophosphohydrolase [Prevotellaceae bacterium]|nr:nucleoside triphosphate pyrophosphohydrolase [Prevotellaceae bacterium]
MTTKNTVPPTSSSGNAPAPAGQGNASFGRLLAIMTELREKCPWDREQTFASLRPQTIEETYELSEAVLADDYSAICKELGDVLLHVVFYAKMGEESGHFTIDDVITKLCEKLIFRHPHVFSETAVKDASEVVQNWEQLKLKEKGGNKTVLSGVPVSLPSLVKACRIQDKARAAGFDWDVREQVWDKVAEEMGELQTALAAGVPENIEDEFGDLLFSIVNAARLYHINPDTALECTNRKFTRRFNYLEQQAIQKGRSLKDMSLDEMNEIWEQAKIMESGEWRVENGAGAPANQ